MRVLVVPVRQGQRTDRRGPEKHPPQLMQAVEIVKIAVVEIAVVVAVVVQKGQARQASRTIGLQELYDGMVVWFWNDSLVWE